MRTGCDRRWHVCHSPPKNVGCGTQTPLSEVPLSLGGGSSGLGGPPGTEEGTRRARFPGTTCRYMPTCLTRHNL